MLCTNGNCGFVLFFCYTRKEIAIQLSFVNHSVFPALFLSFSLNTLSLSLSHSLAILLAHSLQAYTPEHTQTYRHLHGEHGQILMPAGSALLHRYEPLLHVCVKSVCESLPLSFFLSLSLSLESRIPYSLLICECLYASVSERGSERGQERGERKRERVRASASVSESAHV